MATTMPRFRRCRRPRANRHPFGAKLMAIVSICFTMAMVNYPQTFLMNVNAKAWGDDLGLRPRIKSSSSSSSSTDDNTKNIVPVSYCPLGESDDHEENANLTRSKNYYVCPNEGLGPLYTVCCHENECCVPYRDFDGRTSYYIAMCSFIFSLLALFIFCLCSAFKWCPFFSFCEKEHLNRESKIYEMQQFRQNGTMAMNGSALGNGMNNMNNMNMNHHGQPNGLIDDPVPVIQINDSPLDPMDYYNNHNHQQPSQIIIANGGQNHSTASLLLNNVNDVEHRSQEAGGARNVLVGHHDHDDDDDDDQGGGLPMPSILVNPMAMSNDVMGGANVVPQQQQQQQQPQQQLNNGSYSNHHYYRRLHVGGDYAQQQQRQQQQQQQQQQPNNMDSYFDTRIRSLFGVERV